MSRPYAVCIWDFELINQVLLRNFFLSLKIIVFGRLYGKLFLFVFCPFFFSAVGWTLCCWPSVKVMAKIAIPQWVFVILLLLRNTLLATYKQFGWEYFSVLKIRLSDQVPFAQNFVRYCAYFSFKSIANDAWYGVRLSIVLKSNYM